MWRREGARDERKLLTKNHRAAHLPKISPLGTLSHHPGNSVDIGPHRPGETDEDHRLLRVNLITMTHQSKAQATGVPLGTVDPTLHLPLAIPRCAVEMKEIAKNFTTGDLSRCLIARRRLCLEAKNDLNVIPGTQDRGVMMGSTTCREAAEVMLQ